MRFWLWFAASLKFLIPFAALAALGERLAAQLPVTVVAEFSTLSDLKPALTVRASVTDQLSCT